MAKKGWCRARVFLTGAVCFGLFEGSCLPENYYASTARFYSVLLVDHFVLTALTPIFEFFSVDTDSENGSNGTNGT